MKEAVIQTIQSSLGLGAGGTIVIALLYLLTKVIEKYRPSTKRKSDVLALHDQEILSLQRRVLFAEEQVDQMGESINKLRAAVERLSRERHYFFEAIIRCSVEHKETAVWWTHELSEITKKLDSPEKN